jgi:hypothetical protein
MEEHLKTYQHLSRRASQQSIPVAIAESHVATAKGRSRAVIELIVEAAMVWAVEAALSESAMVSKWPRQELAPPLRNRDRDRIAANAGRDRARWGQTADDANCSHFLASSRVKADAARQRCFEMRRSSGEKSARGFSRFRSIEPTEFKRTQDAMRTRARARAERHSVRDR